MDEIFDQIIDTAFSLMFVVLSAVVTGFLIVLFLGGFGLVRRLNGAEDTDSETPPRPTRMFGAPPGSRWLMAYDYWLFQLERVTGIEFNIDPARLLIGCVLISVGPALMTGLILDMVDPAPSFGWTLGLGLVALVIGVVTGRMQAAPAVGWFDTVSSSRKSGSTPSGRHGFLDLGEDD